jgi:hypothetical protein
MLSHLVNFVFGQMPFCQLIKKTIIPTYFEIKMICLPKGIRPEATIVADPTYGLTMSLCIPLGFGCTRL